MYTNGGEFYECIIYNILDPKAIKIIWVFAAHEHIHTIESNDMNFDRSPIGIRLRPPANCDNIN